jgi:hypothetical protein
MNRPRKKAEKAVAISATDLPEREADTPIVHPVAVVAVAGIAEAAGAVDETVAAVAAVAADAIVADSQT